MRNECAPYPWTGSRPLRARPDLLDTTEQALRRGEMIACTPRSWERVSDIVTAVTDKHLRHTMIAGTVGLAAAAEFAQAAAEIEALVSLQEIIDAPAGKRPLLGVERLESVGDPTSLVGDEVEEPVVVRRR